MISTHEVTVFTDRIERLEALLASTTKQLRDTQDERDRLDRRVVLLGAQLVETELGVFGCTATGAEAHVSERERTLVAMVERAVRALIPLEPIEARAIESDLRALLGETK